MQSAFWGFLALLGLTLGPLKPISAQGTSLGKGDLPQNTPVRPLPTGVILVKGAWASASDSATPLPEGGSLADHIYSNSYFGLTYTLVPGWTQKNYGPPPSDTGYYVLVQITPADPSTRASLLITAQDLFFTPTPAANVFELIDSSKRNLEAYYQVERPPTPVGIAHHSFVRFDYFSPVAGLHWYVLATEIRCHLVQFIFTGGDAKLLESLIRNMDQMSLPADASPVAGTGDGDVPVCVHDYARAENVIERVDPVFAENRFNPIPVRIIIDTEGKVKHIHFLSAFPDQAKSITDALSHWRFKPYLRDGHPTEVETGIMFGRERRPTAPFATGPNE